MADKQDFKLISLEEEEEVVFRAGHRGSAAVSAGSSVAAAADAAPASMSEPASAPGSDAPSRVGEAPATASASSAASASAGEPAPTTPEQAEAELRRARLRKQAAELQQAEENLKAPSVSKMQIGVIVFFALVVVLFALCYWVLPTMGGAQ